MSRRYEIALFIALILVGIGASPPLWAQRRVPNIIGKLVSEAKQIILNAGFQFETDPPDAADPDRVSGQIPNAGNQLDAGDTVLAVVDAPPPGSDPTVAVVSVFTLSAIALIETLLLAWILIRLIKGVGSAPKP